MQQLPYDAQLWAGLVSIPGVGRVTFSQILHECTMRGLRGEAAWQALPRLGFVRTKPELQESIKQFQARYALADYWQWLQEQQITIIGEGDQRYPSLLREISDRPPVLFVQGKLGAWEQLPVAVVGTRRATGYGRLATDKLVSELVSLGCTIISGFMYGVDVLAQEAAVRANGQTVGVLGFGFNHMYPSSQRRLYQNWLAAGQTFITEFPPDTRPTKGTFPSRNRIVAGLSRGVIVVEAAAQSGSLITANLALEYGREVMAVPGPMYSTYSEGTTALINQGATLVTSGRQVLQAIGEVPSFIPAGQTESSLSGLQRSVYASLQVTPQTETQLQQALQSPMGQVLTALSMMEVAGWLKKTGEFWVVNV